MAVKLMLNQDEGVDFRGALAKERSKGIAEGRASGATNARPAEVYSISILSFIINQRVEEMPSVQALQRFYEVLLESSQRKSAEIAEFNQKASRGCPIKFTLHLAQNLEISEQLTLAGLLIAKRAVDRDLKISKKFLHRLIVVCVLIAEKCFEEEQNETETYSLLSGVPIKDLLLLEGKVLNFLDYRLLPQGNELDHILRGDAWGLFSPEAPPQ